MKHLSTAVSSLVIITIPILVWAEQSNQNVWNNRLLTPLFTTQNFHTPKQTDGTIVKPTFHQDTTLTPSSNPHIITNTVTIPPGTTLTLDAGTTILLNEFGRIENYGQLISNGTKQNPVTITTNEAHPDNQLWHGITSHQNAITALTHTNISHGAPAISCLVGSTVTMNQVNISKAQVGVFVDSQNCVLNNSGIKASHEGLRINKDGSPTIINTTIND